MPIFEAPGQDIVSTGQPAPEKPKVWQCTISPDDKGEDCHRCGLPYGPGHAKARG